MFAKLDHPGGKQLVWRAMDLVSGAKKSLLP